MNSLQFRVLSFSSTCARLVAATSRKAILTALAGFLTPWLQQKSVHGRYFSYQLFRISKLATSVGRLRPACRVHETVHNRSKSKTLFYDASHVVLTWPDSSSLNHDPVRNCFTILTFPGSSGSLCNGLYHQLLSNLCRIVLSSSSGKHHIEHNLSVHCVEGFFTVTHQLPRRLRECVSCRVFVNAGVHSVHVFVATQQYSSPHSRQYLPFLVSVTAPAEPTALLVSSCFLVLAFKSSHTVISLARRIYPSFCAVRRCISHRFSGATP